MPIAKHYLLKPDEYHQMHSRIRRRLSQIAFDAYYKCARCGSHDRLQIHIPNPDPALEDQPGFSIILCHQCHKNTHAS